jgi:hypothetical protein
MSSTSFTFPIFALHLHLLCSSVNERSLASSPPWLSAISYMYQLVLLSAWRLVLLAHCYFIYAPASSTVVSSTLFVTRSALTSDDTVYVPCSTPALSHTHSLTHITCHSISIVSSDFPFDELLQLTLTTITIALSVSLGIFSFLK